MLYPNTLRKMIQNEILESAEENGVTLTDGELKSAIEGVEYCISECMADSVQDALSNIIHDRKLDSNFPEGMPDSFKNFIGERKQNI